MKETPGALLDETPDNLGGFDSGNRGTKFVDKKPRCLARLPGAPEFLIEGAITRRRDAAIERSPDHQMSGITKNDLFGHHFRLGINGPGIDRVGFLVPSLFSIKRQIGREKNKIDVIGQLTKQARDFNI